MEYTILGRTGLRVSVLGLGCGGPSRLGALTGRSEADGAAVVGRALDLGINFIDTAELYETEGIVGQGLKGRDRGAVVISTKKTVYDDRGFRRAADVREGLERSLKLLGTDYVDVYHAHGVRPEHYAYVREEIAPCLLSLREEGKVRFVGITERFADDPQHTTLARAVRDDCWDVMMAGFNLLNPSARETLFPETLRKQVGVLAMIVFRPGFRRPQRVMARLKELAVERGAPPDGFDPEDPLGFLFHEGGAGSMADAAYRFCRWEPGVSVVLSGTGNPDHLTENAASAVRPPLPEADLSRLRALLALAGD